MVGLFLADALAYFKFYFNCGTKQTPTNTKIVAPVHILVAKRFLPPFSCIVLRNTIIIARI